MSSVLDRVSSWASGAVDTVKSVGDSLAVGERALVDSIFGTAPVPGGVFGIMTPAVKVAHAASGVVSGVANTAANTATAISNVANNAANVTAQLAAGVAPATSDSAVAPGLSVPWWLKLALGVSLVLGVVVFVKKEAS